MISYVIIHNMFLGWFWDNLGGMVWDGFGSFWDGLGWFGFGMVFLGWFGIIYYTISLGYLIFIVSDVFLWMVWDCFFGCFFCDGLGCFFGIVWDNILYLSFSFFNLYSI